MIEQLKTIFGGFFSFDSGLISIVIYLIAFGVAVYFFFRTFGKKLNEVNLNLISEVIMIESNKISFISIFYVILFVLSLVFNINMTIITSLCFGLLFGIIWMSLEEITNKWK